MDDLAAPGAPGEEFRAQRESSLAPAEVRRLSALSPLRATAPIAQNMFAIAILFVVARRFQHPLAWLCIALVMTAQQHGLAVLVHESAHYRLYQTRWLNDMIGRLLGFSVAISMLAYRIVHRTHHNHLYEPIDPDLALMAGYPRGRLYLLRKLLKDLFGLTASKNLLYFAGAEVVIKVGSRDTSSELRRAARRDQRIALFVPVVLGLLSFALGAGRYYVALWLLPYLTLLQPILRLRAICEHGAVPDTRTTLGATRTTLPSIWVRWVLFPHHVYYHTEHHLYPSVPHYRLAECHHALAQAGVLAQAHVLPLSATLRRVFADRAPAGETGAAP
jgi:fatty acid desaturase